MKKKLRSNDTESGLAAKPCKLPRRLAVMLYDSLVVIALLLLATALALLVGFEQVTAGKDVLFTLYLLVVWFLYVAWFWHRGGMTVGMRTWHVHIEREDGRCPGWGQCLLRFLVSLVSAACFGTGFAWSLFDVQKRTWHDLASNTRLVRR